MKALKLSLAAVCAAGAFASLNAAPLEEAIKDIDVSGFARYRYDISRYEMGEVLGGERDKSGSTSFHRFTLDVNFKATLDDNFFSFISTRYNTRDTSYAGKNHGITNNRGGLDPMNGWGDSGWGGPKADSLSIRQYYVGFTGIPDTVVLVGRFPLDTYFDYDVVGTGIKIINNSITGLTLAAFAVDNIENNDDTTDLKMANGEYVLQNNLYGLAAVGSWDWFSAQAWFAHLQNVASLWAVELGANYAINDDVSIRGKLQVAGSSPTGNFKNDWRKAGTTVKGSTFLGVTAGLSAYGFDADLGYAHYGKKDALTFNTIQYTGHLVLAGENLLGYTESGYSGQVGGSNGAHSVFMAKAKYTFDKFWIGADYVYDKAKGSWDTFGIGGGEYKKGQEIVARVGYKYSDKMEFRAWHSWETKKYEDVWGNGYKNKWNYFRFDATYTF